MTTTNLDRITTIIMATATPMTALDRILDIAAGPEMAANQVVVKRV
jgi:hypothetical protein